MEELSRLVQRLTDTSCDIETRRKAVEGIRDSQELWHTKEYGKFLEQFLDPVITQLTNTQPQFQDTELHKLRSSLLEVLSKLPPNEVLRPYARKVLQLCLQLLNSDNQANGVVAMRLLLDIAKGLVRTSAQGYEQVFSDAVDFITRLYSHFPETYSQAFITSPANLPNDFSHTFRSLKMVAEAPLPLMFLIQLFPALAKARVPAMVPSMIAAVCQRGPDISALPGPPPAFWEHERLRLEREQMERREKGLAAGPGADSRWHEQVQDKWREALLGAIQDLKIGQVRTLNFLNMMVRNLQLGLQPYPDQLCSTLLYLFRSAPDTIAIRRELLAATRYLLASPQKGACFVNNIDEILRPGTLLNHSMASMDTLKPLLVMTMCEVLHHVRKSFNLDQLSKVVNYMAICVADRSLPYHCQSTCVRLSLNMVECLYSAFKRPESDMAARKQAQSLLSKVAGIFVSKLQALAQSIPTMLTDAMADQAARLKVQAKMLDPEDTDTSMVLYLQAPGEREKEMNDCKLVLQNVVYGAKTVLFSIGYCLRCFHVMRQWEAQRAAARAAGQQEPQAPAVPSQIPGVGMPDADVRTCATLLSAGLACLKLSSFTGEGKELYEQFAEVFTVMEPRDFTDIFTTQMDTLFDTMAADADALAIAAHLVQNAQVGRSFNAVLAKYLTENKLHLLADHKTKDALLVQKLFRLVFLGLTMEEGEMQLVPFILQLVRKCLEAATTQPDPIAYLQLLRILFKHCHVAREPLAHLHNELAILLKGALDTLLAMLNGPNCGQVLKPLLVELVLLLPAALRVLVELTLLPSMVKPLVMALQGSEELVSSGLRTFELWVDSLNPEYLEKALGTSVNDVMAALWSLLKPNHSLRPHALAAMQLLGKLGGRNRKFLHDPAALEYKDNPEHGLRLILTFSPATSFLVPMDKCVALAKAGLAPQGVLSNTASHAKYYRQQALFFIQVCLSAVLNLRAPLDSSTAAAGSSEDGGSSSTLSRLATVLLEGKHPPTVQPVLSRVELGVKTKAQLVAERSVLTSLLAAIIAAAGDEELTDSSKPFCHSICRHYAMLFVAGAGAPPPAPFMSRAVYMGGSGSQQQQKPGTSAAPAASSNQAGTAGGGSSNAAGSAAAAGGDQQQQQQQSNAASAAPAARPNLPAAMPRSLAELDVHLFVDAVLEVLCDANPRMAAGAFDALSVFIDTMQQLVAAKQRYQAAAATAADNASTDHGAAPAAEGRADGSVTQASSEAGPTPAAAARPSAAKASSTAKSSAADHREPLATQHKLPVVLDDIMKRLIHCCWDDQWSTRLGGVSAMMLLLEKLPAGYLRLYAPRMLRGFFAVVRALPDHSVSELKMVKGSISLVLSKCYNKGEASLVAASPEAGKANGPAGSETAASASEAAAATVVDGEAKQQEHADSDKAATNGAQDSKQVAKSQDKPEASGDKPAASESKDGGGDAGTGDAAQAAAANNVEAAKEQDSAAKQQQDGAAKELQDVEINAQQQHKEAADGSSERKDSQMEAKHAKQGAAPVDPGAKARAAWATPISDVLLSVTFSSSSNYLARNVATASLKQLSQELDVPMSMWLSPVLQNMSPSLLARKLIPVRSVQQLMGQVYALTWALNTCPSLSTAGADALAVAKEALTLADRDEMTLLQRLPGRNLTLKQMTQLRIACIELLDALMTNEAFRSAPEPAPGLRDDITAMLFRALVCDMPEVYNAARTALEHIMAVGKIPKNLLQNSLRPILQNLGDYRRLTLPLLNGLARLLELLSDWFNLTLGERLIEHLRNWLDPDALLQAGPFQWKSGEEVAIAAAILDLFWRLPRTAVKFLETQPSPAQAQAAAAGQASPRGPGGSQPGLVVLTIQLEEQLPRMPAVSPLPNNLTSEYRAPLLRFLNRYPAEGVAYFMDSGRIQNSSYFNMFTALLEMPDASPLRDMLASNTDKLLALLGVKEQPADFGASGTTGAPAVAAASVASTNGVAAVSLSTAKGPVPAEPSGPILVAHRAVKLIELLLKHRPDWLPAHPAVFDVLWKRLKEQGAVKPYTSNEPTPPFWLVVDQHRVTRCMLAYLAAHHELVKPLPDLCACTVPFTGVELGLVQDYASSKVVKEYDIQHQRALLLAWAQEFKRFCNNVPHIAAVAVSTSVQSMLTAGTGTHAERVQCAMVHSLVLPLLTAAQKQAEDADQLVNLEVVQGLANDVLRIADSHAAYFGEVLRICILHFCVELIKAARPIIAQNKGLRDVLVKYSWRFLKVPDESPCRTWAFLATVHLLPLSTPGGTSRDGSAEQQAPSKPGGIERMVAQVWVSLLRVNQPEPRKGLMKEVLDTLVPTLVDKLGSRGSDGKITWVRYAKKQVLDESGALTNLLQFWQLVVRHPHVFYTSRVQFMSQMCNTLSRIGMPQQASPENRKLSLDLAGLLLAWETQARQLRQLQQEHQAESKSVSHGGFADAGWGADRQDAAKGPQKRPMEDGAEQPPSKLQKWGSGAAAAAGGADGMATGEEFEFTEEMQSIVVNFLVRMAVLVGENQDKDSELQALHQHTLKLLTQALTLFPNTQVKLSSFLERLLQGQAHKSPMPVLVTGWEVVSRLLDLQPHLFARTSAPQFVQLLQPCFKLQHQHVVQLVCGVIKKLFKLQPWREQVGGQGIAVQSVDAANAAAGAAPTAAVQMSDPAVVNAAAAVGASGVMQQQGPGLMQQPSNPMVPGGLPGAAPMQPTNGGGSILNMAQVPPGPAAAYPAAAAAVPAAAPAAPAAAVASVAPAAPAALTPAVAPATATTPAAAAPPQQQQLAIVKQEFGTVSAVAPPSVVQPAASAVPPAAAATDALGPAPMAIDGVPANQVQGQADAVQAQQQQAAANAADIDLNIWQLQNAVLQHVRPYITAASDPQQQLLVQVPPKAQGGQPTYASSDTLVGVCFSLAALRAIHEVSSDAVIATHLSGLVRLLNRCARDVCATFQNGQMHQQHYQMMAKVNKEAASAGSAVVGKSAAQPTAGTEPKGGQCIPSSGPAEKAAVTVNAAAMPADGALVTAEPEPAATAADIPQPEYSTVTWVLDSVLQQIGNHAFGNSECKKHFLQSIIIIVTANGARFNEPMLFMRILLLYREWLQLPPHLMTVKEAVLLLQRLAFVQDKFESTSGSSNSSMWHNLFLDVVYGVCTSKCLPPELSDEVFHKVERLFLLGMKAPDPYRRSRFFALYHKLVAAGLFERLQFIICTQDWQSVSNTFWLKPALDLILAVLKEDDNIMLAPNSAQAPPLMPGTRSNVFNPSSVQQQQKAAATPVAGQAGQQQRAAAVSTNQQQQQPSGTAGAANAAAGSPADGQAAASGQGVVAQQQGAQPPNADQQAALQAPTSALADQQAAAEAAPHQAGQPVVKHEPQQQHDTTVKPEIKQEQQESTPANGQQTHAQHGSASAAADQQQSHGALAGSQPLLSGVMPEADIPEDIKQLLSDHLQFLAATGKYTVSNMMGPLREYAQVDPYVAYHLWVLVFPIVWATLQKQQQINLAKPIISLLSKEYHQRQSVARPNVVQALLEGISLSQPQPKIPPELIKYLGKAFNAWHIAIPLLESHVIIFPDETRCFDALAELYKLVGEEDMLIGLWRRRCVHPSTRVALSLLQMGMVERAQALLAELNSAVSAGQIKPSARGEANPQTGDVPRGEMVLWVDSWVSCSKTLTQWDGLAEYAQATDNLPLAMDCLWRLHSWDLLHTVLESNKGQLEPTVSSCMLNAYVALKDADQHTASQQVDKAFQYALGKWWQMPETGWTPQLNLLQVFQQLVELRESGRVLMDVQQHQQQMEQQYSDTKDILETWRLRTPNEWDTLTHWQDVLLWRNHIYNVVITAFNTMSVIAPQLHQMGYRDKAWSVNKLGHVAYKHGCPDVCITVINNMYGYNAMEVQEAFVKIKEQARAYLAMPLDLQAGLNMLNTTNLDYFANYHQAEIFRLKALFMAEPSMNDLEGAHSALSTALCLWRQCPDAWLSWGKLCDARYEAAPTGPNALQFLQFAAHCYLAGIRLSTVPQQAPVMKGRNEEALTSSLDLLPRLLHLLAFCNLQGVVGEQVQQTVDDRSLPAWVWFMWIPQLLTSLTRPEVHRVKPILKQLAELHPQSIYYSLRTFVLGLRETAQRAMQEYNRQHAALQATIAASQQAGDAAANSEAVHDARARVAALEPSAEATGFEAGKEIMERLRSQHSILGSSMESMLAEIGSRFVPRPMERLLAVVTALLHRCYKLPVANSSTVPHTLKKEMSGVCKACFAGDASKVQARSLQQPIEMRDSFLHDLDPEGPAFPATVGELADKLKAWRTRLQAELEAAMPGYLKLEEECRALQDIHLADIELPGQYLAGHEITPDSSVFLEAISCNVAIVRRSANSYRRLAFLCSDGMTRMMLVQTGQNSSQGQADERMMQLLRLLNRLLSRNVESMRRQLAWHTPVIVPVWPQVRLFEDEPSYCSYGEAYDINCARFGRDPDMPIVHFKKRVSLPDGTYAPDPDSMLRLQAYSEICDKVVSENVFSQYMYKTLPTCNHLWLFKKYFCSQLALSGLLCYMLLLSGRSPNKILFAKNSGALFQLDLLPLYGDKGLIERLEVVPYRLTRNLATFFTAFGVEGVFVPTQVAAAAAMLAHDSNLHTVLCQFFKEDLLAWTSRKGKGSAGSSGSVLLPNDTLKNLVVKNARQVAERIKHFAPAHVGEDELPAAPIHQNALDLAEAATSPKTLCRMDPTWHPWF